MNDKMLALSFGLLLGGALLAVPAFAQSANCAPHDMVLERLADGYGESRQSIALSGDNAVVEMWANRGSGTWTLTVTMPGGPTCLVASGQAFELLAEGVPNRDEGA